MLETLKELILDFQEMHLKTGVPRRVSVSTIPGKATVCIGVRRCGKSTFMFQIMKQMLDSGVSRNNILYLNFFDDRLHRLQ
jgi:predicted AAA+ superfamily ATPase